VYYRVTVCAGFVLRDDFVDLMTSPGIVQCYLYVVFFNVEALERKATRDFFTVTHNGGSVL
jgi:hypothetical protein